MRSHPSRLTVVGLDLAWSPRNPTGGSVVLWDGRTGRLAAPPRADLGGNDEIVSYVAEATGDGPAVVAIDCPLAVPNASGLRACDVLVNRFFREYEAGVYPANRRNLGRYGGLRGLALSEALAAEDFSLDPRRLARRSVIEVYPHAATVTLFNLRRTLKYKSRRGRSYEERWRELGRLQRLLRGLRHADPPLILGGGVVGSAARGVRGAALKALEDGLDSLVCAYVGLLYGIEETRRIAIFGDAARGHIAIPMTPALWNRHRPLRSEALFMGP